MAPQPGPQTAFLATKADIAIGGGAAGGGKTYGLILDPIRFFNLDYINGAIFRRHQEDLTLPGAVWIESQKVYAQLGLTPNLTKLQYRFSKNSYLKFSGLQYEYTVLKWQGAQLDFLGFDELTHFSEDQFWYLIGRLRSVSGQIIPYCRATCNPEKGWVFELLEWWIDKTTGYPIPERSGKLRWLLRIDDVKYWFDTKEAALEHRDRVKLPDKIQPLSVTFIPSTLNDNQILLKNDPTYYAKLAQMSEAQKQKLLYGRWFFAPTGKLFKALWFQHFVIDPTDPDVTLVTTDSASGVKTANDYTVFQLWIRSKGKIYLLKQLRGRFTASEQLNLLIHFLLNNKVRYVSIEKASTGFHLIQEIVQKTGVILLEMTRNKDKYMRAFDIQEYVERGYCYLNPNADYYADLVAEMCALAPENKNRASVFDDQADCFIDAVHHLLVDKIGYNQTKIDLKPHYTFRRK